MSDYVLQRGAGEFVSYIRGNGAEGFGYNTLESEAVVFKDLESALLVLYRRDKAMAYTGDSVVRIYRRAERKYTYEEI